MCLPWAQASSSPSPIGHSSIRVASELSDTSSTCPATSSLLLPFLHHAATASHHSHATTTNTQSNQTTLSTYPCSHPKHSPPTLTHYNASQGHWLDIALLPQPWRDTTATPSTYHHHQPPQKLCHGTTSTICPDTVSSNQGHSQWSPL